MIHCKSIVEIPRPVAEVFAYLSDPARRPEWQHGLVEHEVEPYRVGARIRDVRNVLGRRVEVVGVVTAYENGSSFTVTASGPAIHSLVYETRFFPLNTGTHVETTVVVEVSNFLGITQPIVKRFIQRETDIALAAARDLLESGATHWQGSPAVRPLSSTETSQA